MARLVCPQCDYSREFTEREEEFGMICPKCHCGRMRRPLRMRRGRAEAGARPSTVRTLIGAGVGLLLGPPLLVAGAMNLSGRAGYLYARVLTFGVFCLVAGFIALIVGTINLMRDLKNQ